MAEDRDIDAAAKGENEPRGPQCGERLAAARAERDISLSDIAKELHISDDKVEALERNEFDNLGAAVFARGYIRKYAQLVGMDEAELVAEHDTLVSETNVLPVLKARPRPRREMSPGPWIVLIVLVVLTASAYWWFVERPLDEVASVPASDSGPSVSAAEEVTAPPSQEQPTEDMPIESPAATTIDDPPQPEGEIIEAADAEAQDDPGVEAAVEPAAPDDGRLRLLLTFTGDCWTEISDGNGRRLFFGLGSDGRTVELSGQAPINALFGNASNVRIEVNGAAYEIRPEERRGRTARLTIAGS